VKEHTGAATGAGAGHDEKNGDGYK
jgi:hypothetical protein